MWLFNVLEKGELVFLTFGASGVLKHSKLEIADCLRFWLELSLFRQDQLVPANDLSSAFSW
jgi:hypothetical protein